MYVKKNIPLIALIRLTGYNTVVFLLWAVAVYVFHVIFHDIWVDMPWLPISVIGTAVAFYVGFKNNQAYDRLWEARKIWGGIVNDSRAWGSMIKSYVSDLFTEGKLSEGEIKEEQRTLIYRHMAWLYSLRSQLLIPTQWEHISQGRWAERNATRQMARFGVGLIDANDTVSNLKKFIPKSEYEELINYKNTATQIIDCQGEHLHRLRTRGLIDDFRQVELQNLLRSFYAYQGKCERIKKFPLPRQYGCSSHIFTNIFLFLLPFGMISEFHQLGETVVWLAIPFACLVAWVFIMMELVGDYSENPFEGLGNDIPMLALCRTIEIDLREMLREKDIPENIKPVNNVLM